MGSVSPVVLQAQLEFFFAVPTDSGHRQRQEQSTLYLLRREVQDCLIGVVVPEHEVFQTPRRPHRLFASMMVIFAGIDLLGKFAKGGDARGEVKQRFKDLIKTYMPFATKTAEDERHSLWLVRNSLIHAFGLNNPEHSPQVSVTTEPWPPIQGLPVVERMTIQGTAVWLVSIPRLYLVGRHSRFVA